MQPQTVEEPRYWWILSEISVTRPRFRRRAADYTPASIFPTLGRRVRDGEKKQVREVYTRFPFSPLNLHRRFPSFHRNYAFFFSREKRSRDLGAFGPRGEEAGEKGFFGVNSVGSYFLHPFSVA